MEFFNNSFIMCPPTLSFVLYSFSEITFKMIRKMLEKMLVMLKNGTINHLNVNEEKSLFGI